MDLLGSLVNMVKKFRPHHLNHGELEFRIGFYDSLQGTFSAGVSRETFEQLEREMTDTLHADRVWAETVDYFYTNDAGRTLRTRVSFDNRNMTMGRTHIMKETCEQIIIARDDDPSDACRVACAIEHPATDLPTSALVNYVRVKQQKRFVDKRDDHVVWNFELSKTWSASSRDTVEYLQHHTEPNYEIECELVDEQGSYMKERTDDEVAASILLKIKMLLGEDVKGHVHLVAPSKPTKRARSRRATRASES